MPVDADARRIYPHAHYLAREMTRARAHAGRFGRGAAAHPGLGLQLAGRLRVPPARVSAARVDARRCGTRTTTRPRIRATRSSRRRVSVSGRRRTDEMGELLVQLVPRFPGELADAARRCRAQRRSTRTSRARRSWLPRTPETSRRGTALACTTCGSGGWTRPFGSWSWRSTWRPTTPSPTTTSA